MNNISLTIPMESAALTRAADMLHGLAMDILPVSETGNTMEKPTGPVKKAEQPARPAQPAGPIEKAEPAAPAEPAQPAATNEPDPAKAFGAATTPGVELDIDGLPWDARIHSGSKSKLAKTEQWKKKRGVHDFEVEKVEAELRAAMAAGPDQPIVEAGDTVNVSGVTGPDADQINGTHTVTEPVQGHPQQGVYQGQHTEPANPAQPTESPASRMQQVGRAEPANPAQPSATTFPVLMAKITAAGIDNSAVVAAVNKQGLTALPLLAARPDLIPAVEAELFS